MRSTTSKLNCRIPEALQDRIDKLVAQKQANAPVGTMIYENDIVIVALDRGLAALEETQKKR